MGELWWVNQPPPIEQRKPEPTRGKSLDDVPKYFEMQQRGMSYAEIAEELGVTIGTISNRIARWRIKQRLNRED